jgi:hypothetical protein
MVQLESETNGDATKSGIRVDVDRGRMSMRLISENILDPK